MKSLILNGHLLPVSPAEKERLEQNAQLHRRYSALEFKILECTDETLVVRIVQEKSQHENYFDAKRLVEIVHEMFDSVAGNRAVRARPIPFDPPPTHVVTPDWIKKKVTDSGLKGRQLSHDLGVDLNTINAYKNGLKPLSGVVKAMFFYYFRS